MICPKCGGNTEVSETRRNKSGSCVRRRRGCEVCHFLFTTYERITSDDWVKSLSKLEKIISTMRKKCESS